MIFHKNEINSSLSTQIGVLTALIAALFYALTNFDYTDSLGLSIVFALMAGAAAILLTISIRYLIESI